jgi:hypothetical protein
MVTALYMYVTDFNVIKFLMENPDMIIIHESVLHSVGLSVIKNDVECLAILDSVV